MTDIRAVFIGDKMISDFALATGALQDDMGLETAFVLSLFTDRRAEPDDELPVDAEDRRGWWGDVAPPMVNGRAVDGDRIGSRLWLLGREKQVQSVLVRAKFYIEECLEWAIEDGLCEQIDVATWIERNGVLGFSVDAHKPNGDILSFKYFYAWRAQQEAS